MGELSKDIPERDAAGAKRAEREARLAQALRENLRKRKAQTRARGASKAKAGTD